MNETKKLLKALQDPKLNPGWRVEHRKSGHYVAFPPDKAFAPIFIAATPSDWRALKNTRSLLRNAGAQGI